MNDAKSMLMMYSYAAMKAAEDKEDKATAETTIETNAKAAKEAEDNKTKRRGKKNDKGTERGNSTELKERVSVSK